MPETTIEALVDGGSANAGPPLGPALGPMGVNIGDIVAAINEKTKDFKGMQVPIKVIIESSDKSFRIEIGTPPVSALIKKEIGLDKGSGAPNLEKVADMPMQAAVKVARMKQDSLLAKDLKAATKEILGTCVPMGIMVEGMDARDAQKAIDRGDYDTLFNEGANLEYDKEAMQVKIAALQAKIKPKEKKEEEAAEAAAEETKEEEPKKEEPKKPESKGKAKTKSMAKASSAKKR